MNVYDGGDMPFSGIFDGCGHRITADLTSENGCAPFKNIRNAKINSLKISGSVYGGMHSSGLVHSMQNIYQIGNYQFQLPDHSLIEDCYLDVNVKLGSATHAGGVIGHGGTSAVTMFLTDGMPLIFWAMTMMAILYLMNLFTISMNLSSITLSC